MMFFFHSLYRKLMDFWLYIAASILTQNPFFFPHLQVWCWQWWLLGCLSALAQTWCGRGFAGSCWRTFHSAVLRACSLDWCRLSVGKPVRASVIHIETVSVACSSFLSAFNDRCLLPLFFRPDALGRIIGNIVLTNKKAQFVITHKLLLLQYKYEVRR